MPRRTILALLAIAFTACSDPAESHDVSLNDVEDDSTNTPDVEVVPDAEDTGPDVGDTPPDVDPDTATSDVSDAADDTTGHIDASEDVAVDADADAPSDADADAPSDAEADTPSDALADAELDADAEPDADARPDADADTDVPSDTEPDVISPDVGPPPCVPESEVCDGLDDDCDGVVDNGCEPCGSAHWAYLSEFSETAAPGLSVAAGRGLVFGSEVPDLISDGVADPTGPASETTGYRQLDHVATEGGGVLVLWQDDSTETSLSEYDALGSLLWTADLELDSVEQGEIDLSDDGFGIAVTIAEETWFDVAPREAVADGLTFSWSESRMTAGSVVGLEMVGPTLTLALDGPEQITQFDADGGELWSLELPEGTSAAGLSSQGDRVALIGTVEGDADADVWIATASVGAASFAWEAQLDWGGEDHPVGLQIDASGELIVVVNGADGDGFARALRMRPGAGTVTWEATYRYSQGASASFAADDSLVWSGTYDGPSGRGQWTRRFHTPCAGDRSTSEALVFVLSGQSNMDGHGPLSELDASYAFPNDEVDLYWQSTGSLSALVPASTVGGRIGPELSFGQEMAAAFPNQRIVLVKYAVGGTNLHTQWHPGNTPDDPARGPLYLVWQDTVAAGFDAITASGSTPTVAGMAWMQGESDGIDIGNAVAYAANLTRFIVRTREDLGVDHALPFAIGRIFAPTIPFREVVRAGEEAVAAEVLGASWVDTDDLPLVDSIHYNGPGQITLGERMAAAVLNYAPGVPREPPVEPEFDELIPGFVDYEELYDLPVPAAAHWHTESDVAYANDQRSDFVGASIDRIAFLVQLNSRFRDSEWVWISADASVEPAALSVPVDEVWQGPISNVSVRSNVATLASVDGVPGGVEFWSNCYTTGDDGVYDHSDVIAGTDCYGSMQFHAAASSGGEGQVPIFAVNSWASGSDPSILDVGIGPSSGAHPDWTFSRGASAWEEIRVRAFVRPD